MFEQLARDFARFESQKQKTMLFVGTGKLSARFIRSGSCRALSVSASNNRI
jgi:hypothetical protein